MWDEKSGMEEPWHLPLLILQEEKPNWEPSSTWQIQAHRAHTHCSISLTSTPTPALQRFLTSRSALCPPSLCTAQVPSFLGSILTSQAGASICLKFPPSCQNSNTRDKSCNFSFLIASRICINTLVPRSNKIYQELPIPNLTLSPTFCSLYTQNCLKHWHWELITRQGKCHKWLQPFSNQNTHQIAESARYTSLSRL